MGALFEQERHYVRRVLRRYGVADAELDDALQDVFVVVCRRIDSFRGQSQVRTWLHGISRKVASNVRRRAANKRVRPVGALPEHRESSVRAFDMEQDFQLRSIRRALPTIAPEKRDVLMLRAFEGLPMREIARRVGCCVATAYVRLDAARRELSQVVWSVPVELTRAS